MAEGKRYFWLKLYADFFESKRIKKLRRLAGGDTYLVIYLKMQLVAIKTNGILMWTGLEESFSDEIALEIDEEPDHVKVTIAYLLKCGLIETKDGVKYYLPFAVSNTGAECSSAKRVREFRKKAEITDEIKAYDASSTQKALQCNEPVTNCNNPVTESKSKSKSKSKSLDVDVVSRVALNIDDDIDDDNDDDNAEDDKKLKCVRGLGKGVVILSDVQNEDLLDKLTLDEYNEYIGRLADYIIDHPSYRIASHYKTILKWVAEDREAVHG